MAVIDSSTATDPKKAKRKALRRDSQKFSREIIFLHVLVLLQIWRKYKEKCF